MRLPVAHRVPKESERHPIIMCGPESPLLRTDGHLRIFSVYDSPHDAYKFIKCMSSKARGRFSDEECEYSIIHPPSQVLKWYLRSQLRLGKLVSGPFFSSYISSHRGCPFTQMNDDVRTRMKFLFRVSFQISGSCRITLSEHASRYFLGA